MVSDTELAWLGTEVSGTSDRSAAWQPLNETARRHSTSAQTSTPRRRAGMAAEKWLCFMVVISVVCMPGEGDRQGIMPETPWRRTVGRGYGFTLFVVKVYSIFIPFVNTYLVNIL